MTLTPPSGVSAAEKTKQPSRLCLWPVQLHLAPVNAPFFKNADLLIAADCVPFAYADFHRVLVGKVVLVDCPKLDDNRFYLEKLTELFRVSSVRSITVLRMEVPCCGIVTASRQAVATSGKEIPFHEVTITNCGYVKE